MSLAPMIRVLYQSRLKANERLVLLAIADNADDIGVAWPGIPTIAAKMGDVSHQTVRTSMRAAVAKGELLVAWGSGRRGANVYWVRTGVPEDYPWPDEFVDALARSRRMVATGKVKLPLGFELPAPPDPSKTQEGCTPPEFRGGAFFDPSRILTDPSRMQEGTPSNLQEGNPQSTIQEPCAREAASVLDQIRQRLGQAKFGSWFADVHLRDGEAGALIIETASRFGADHMRQEFADVLEKQLGRRIHFMARTPCATGNQGQEGKA